MVQESQTDSWIPCQNGTANNLQTLGRREGQVHLHQTRRRLCPEQHMRHLGVKMELQVPKSKVCHLDLCIYILLIRMLDFPSLMHIRRVASAIMVWIQICWLMKEHPQVSTPSAAWKCSWNPLCRREQPIKRTWQWRRTLIEMNGIVEYFFLYNQQTL